MPAYFEVSFEFAVSETVVENFCTALVDAGLVFKSGYLEFEKESFEEIVQWNQNRLDHACFVSRKRSSVDFKQMLFRYADFSEMRLFMIKENSSDSVRFLLIIPEDDFWDENCFHHTHARKTYKMELIKEIAERIWCNTEVLAIQTAWECSEFPLSVARFSGSLKPQAEPFCIVRSADLADEYCDEVCQQLARNGVVIVDEGAWGEFAPRALIEDNVLWTCQTSKIQYLAFALRYMCIPIAVFFLLGIGLVVGGAMDWRGLWFFVGISVVTLLIGSVAILTQDTTSMYLITDKKIMIDYPGALYQCEYSNIKSIRRVRSVFCKNKGTIRFRLRKGLSMNYQFGMIENIDEVYRLVRTLWEKENKTFQGNKRRKLDEDHDL